MKHLGLLNEHLNMKQDSLNGETDDTDEAKDIKKGIEGLKYVLEKRPWR